MKNVAINFVVSEESQKVFITTIYGLLDVTHLITLNDVTKENGLLATVECTIPMIKYPKVEE